VGLHLNGRGAVTVNCKLFTRLEVAEALTIIRIAEDLGKDPAKLTAEDVQEIQLELVQTGRRHDLERLLWDDPLLRVLDGRIK
jgi:hypothetical protein